MIKINSPKPLTGSPEKIQPFECILTRRAKKLSSQAWGSCIWKSTPRSVAFIQELATSLCLTASSSLNVRQSLNINYVQSNVLLILTRVCVLCWLRGWRGNTTAPVWWGSPKWRSERPSPVLYRKCWFSHTLFSPKHTSCCWSVSKESTIYSLASYISAFLVNRNSCSWI